ncbi:helix-turn-helix domain-containing protein [Phenylobacterium sp.]|uniref:helix-turn-helix domain-containing protein n=1 Tax=Phenylobacterium sp. TaxID=1871053 RepID=UPI0035B0304A
MASALFSERYAAVVEELAASRRAAGVTQAELAARLERPQSFVSKIERQERRIDPVEFYDWASALGISPTALFEAVISRMRAPRPD